MEPDERMQTLLGKHLLGRAADAEIRELQARRLVDPALRDAMDLAERTAAHWRRSAAGEDLRFTSSDLPDYLHPSTLAAGLDRWFRRWLLMSVVSAAPVLGLVCAAAARLTPDADLGRVATQALVLFAVTMGAVVVAAWFARGALAEKIASGGPSWERSVEAVREQERRFFSPVSTAVMGAGGAAAVGGTLVAVAVPGPSGAFALLGAAVAAVVALRIAKRRFLLRGLRGERK